MFKGDSVLFTGFQTEMPRNEDLVEEGLGKVLKGKSVSQIKASFSKLLLEAQRAIYETYLEAERQTGNEVLGKFLVTEPANPLRISLRTI